MQVGEAIAVAVIQDDDECFFEHVPQKHDKENYWKNDADMLSKKLDGASAANEKLHLKRIDSVTIGTGSSGAKNYTATYNPHHILPGDGSWPYAKALLNWIDHHTYVGTKIKGDIEYNVNCWQNGIDLPSNNAMRTKWKTVAKSKGGAGRTPQFQANYAFAAMDASKPRRQFHDSHGPYEDFVADLLNKVAVKIAAIVKKGKCPEGKKHCPLESGDKLVDPPYGLRSRIHAIAGRVARYLQGDWRKWKMPIMTSKFALMYQNRKLTQKQAVEALKNAAANL